MFLPEVFKQLYYVALCFHVADVALRRIESTLELV